MLFMDPNQKEVDPLTFERILTVASQEETFQSVKPFVLSALDGVPVAIFAYGATGSGKTYTMIGDTSIDNPDDAGIIPRVVKEVAASKKIIEAYYEVVEISMTGTSFQNLEYSVFDLVDENRKYVYFMPRERTVRKTGEIHKCMLTDNFKQRNKKYLFKHFNCDDTMVKHKIGDKNVFKHEVIKNKETSFDQAMFNKTFQTIQQRRRTSNTPGNPNGSSRTHLITTIVCRVEDEKKECRISLVDLAGHEQDTALMVDKTEDEKLSFGINQSLNALTTFIKEAQQMGDNNLMNEFVFTGGLLPNSQPLMAFTSDIWSQNAGKVMMMACLHPMHQDWKQHAFDPPMKDPGGRGNLKQDVIKEKLKRDRSVLKRLSDIQGVLNPSS
jgi:hypothetical protein